MCMKPTDLHIEKEVAKISSFIKTGLFTLTVIFIAGIAIIYSQKRAALTTGSFADGVIHQKELPIYSVDTDEPKVALSFDAAWRACRLLNTFSHNSDSSISLSFNTSNTRKGDSQHEYNYDR